MTVVLHLRSGAFVYGAENQILSLTRMHHDQFKSILLIMAPDKNPVPFYLAAKNAGITVEQMPIKGKFSFSFLRDLVDFIKAKQIDILHTHDYKSDLFGFLAANRTGVRLVSTAHGFTESSLKLKLYKRLDLLALRRFDKVITVSNWSRKNLIKLGLPADKVITIYNSVDTNRSKTSDEALDTVKTELKLENGQKIILAIGRLSADKNFSLLLRAFSLVLKDFPDTKLLLAGNGIEKGPLAKLTEELGILNKVIFTGYYQRVQDLIAISDCVAVSSLRETLSMVTLEAMSAGKIVVAGRIGGLPEVITNGANGILVEPNNVSSMAKGLKPVLSGVIDQKKLAAAAIRKIETSFTPEKMLEETTTVYRDLLKANQKS